MRKHFHFDQTRINVLENIRDEFMFKIRFKTRNLGIINNTNNRISKNFHNFHYCILNFG